MAQIFVDIHTYQSGIRWLDTAEGYGTSEETIGKWRLACGREELRICTKVSRLDHTSCDTLLSSLREHVKACCERLHLQTIPLLMLHDPDEFFQDRVHMNRALNKLKKQGMIKKTGVSIYPYHDLHEIAESELDAVQLPFNPLDHRLIENGGIQHAAEKGKILMVRSVFLQGLLVRTPDQMSSQMMFCTDALRKYRALCDAWGREPSQLAIDYALSRKEISGIVIGCRNLLQLQDIVGRVKNGKELNPDQLTLLQNTFRSVDERVITPTMWKSTNAQSSG